MGLYKTKVNPITGKLQIVANQTTFLKNVELNSMLNAFRISILGSLTLQQMVDSFIDEYEDENNVNLDDSLNQTYDPTDDYYTNIALAGEFISDVDTHLLLHFNGLDGETTTVDDSPSAHTIVFSGNTELDDSQVKMGSTSLRNLGLSTSDYVEVQDSLGDFNFGSGDFTLEFFVRFASAPNNRFLLSTVASGANNWQLYYASNALQLSGEPGSINWIGEIWSPNLNQWYHVAVVMQSGTLTFYVDGIAGVNQVENPGSFPNTGAVLRVSGSGFNTSLDGWMDEVRISKGLARYTSNFTPPVESSEVSDMTLISDPQTADSVPTQAKLVIFEEDVEAITLNTDIKGWVSRNGGTTFTQVTLTEEGSYSDVARIISGTATISSQSSGTNMVYKITTHNTKELKIHGTSMLWS